MHQRLWEKASELSKSIVRNYSMRLILLTKDDVNVDQVNLNKQQNDEERSRVQSDF